MTDAMRSAAGRLGIVTVLTLVCFGSAPIAAQEEHLEPASEHFHKNHIALFLGSTQAELEHGEREDPQFTLGLDYERRLTRVVGVGGLIDVVVEGHRDLILGATLFLHAGRLKFLIAPGVELVGDKGDWEFVTRFGVLYEFEVSSALTLAPVVQYDVTEERSTWVVGLGIGKGF